MDERPVLPLNYAGPRSREESVRTQLPWKVIGRRTIGTVRQIVLAAGLGTFAYGLGSALGRGQAADVMCVGGILVGVALPLRRGDRI